MYLRVSGKQGALKLKGALTLYSAGTGFRVLRVLKMSGQADPADPITRIEAREPGVWVNPRRLRSASRWPRRPGTGCGAPQIVGWVGGPEPRSRLANTAFISAVARGPIRKSPRLHPVHRVAEAEPRLGVGEAERAARARVAERARVGPIGSAVGAELEAEAEASSAAAAGRCRGRSRCSRARAVDRGLREHVHAVDRTAVRERRAVDPRERARAAVAVRRPGSRRARHSRVLKPWPAAAAGS